MNIQKILMDEFNYIKNAYQYYIGIFVTVTTFLTVTYRSIPQTLVTITTLFIIAHFLGKWNFQNINSGFNRQNYLIGKYSPPWQTLFKVLWVLSENHPEAKKELEQWVNET